ncbi:hypothetical protein CI109_100559 [Kwoniella shandongensis]|uniref:Uncharacterized protein n=1 Tax=Kwoniella shandongensis TaxID=1734106 RepID=A0A5M6C0L6_9TREE|nr:uncharacterized protein CI109_003520 [Kwoniella shandongensis]KAA5528231.1 hypothetical protein CI109_003520 [Kwoniella shandongensis]
MDKSNDPTMGGLDALVAAASSVAAGKGRSGRGITMDLIDPALQGNSNDPSASRDTADAIGALLTNPAVMQLIAEYNAKKQKRHVSLYTQLLSGSAIPSAAPDTPVQQTRSGRISRPPVHPPSNPLQQFMYGGGGNLFGPNATGGIGSGITNGGGVGTSDSQLQAIKEALENVSAQADDTSTSYDALMQAVGGDPNSSNSSRFWRNADLQSGSSWSGIDAQTLAQAAEASQRGLGHGLPLNGKASSSSRKRSASAMESTEDESVESPGGKRYRVSGDGEGLPAWPLPPTGKGGRKNMPRDELLARRRARNRVAAQESRKKKKEFFGTIADRLKHREDEYAELEAHCNDLEREVEALKKIVLGAGLQLPGDLPTTLGSVPVSGPSHSTPADDTPADSMAGLLPFHDLFTIDDNDADDGDFIPPSSPKRDSESDDSDSDEEDEAPKSRKKKGGKGRVSKVQEEDEEDEAGNGDGAPMAEDEEEDLFLPIEDVPVYPREEEDEQTVMKQAMNELHVDTPQELMGVIKKMVETAGYGGVTEEQVGMLSKLLALGQAQGMSVW